MHYLNHINGEEFKGLLKMFLLRFQMKAKHNPFHPFVGSWNASFKTCCPCLKWLDRGASDSADPDSHHRKGTPVGPQPGRNMFKGSPSSLLLESINSCGWYWQVFAILSYAAWSLLARLHWILWHFGFCGTCLAYLAEFPRTNCARGLRCQFTFLKECCE